MKTHEPGCTAGSSWTFEKGVTYHPCSCGAPDIPLDYGTLIEELRRIDPSPDKSGWTTEAADAINTLLDALREIVNLSSSSPVAYRDIARDALTRGGTTA